MHVYIPCACLVLGVEPRSSEEQPVLLTPEVHLQSLPPHTLGQGRSLNPELAGWANLAGRGAQGICQSLPS